MCLASFCVFQPNSTLCSGWSLFKRPRDAGSWTPRWLLCLGRPRTRWPITDRHRWCIWCHILRCVYDQFSVSAWRVVVCSRWTGQCGPPFWLWSGYTRVDQVTRWSGSLWPWRRRHGSALRNVSPRSFIQHSVLPVDVLVQCGLSLEVCVCVCVSADGLSQCVCDANVLLGCQVTEGMLGIWRLSEEQITLC